MQTGVLYVRISADLLEWIREQAGVTGVPMARVTDALLRWAHDQGATVCGPIAAPVRVDSAPQSGR